MHFRGFANATAQHGKVKRQEKLANGIRARLVVKKRMASVRLQKFPLMGFLSSEAAPRDSNAKSMGRNGKSMSRAVLFAGRARKDVVISTLASLRLNV